MSSSSSSSDLRRSPVTGREVPPSYLHASSAFFRDTQGRAVFLRGVNFSGSSKAPLGQPTQHQPNEDLWEQAEAGGKSFVGQPLNLEDGSADTHLTRLRMWGFNCLRYVFTWEALEHEGPGKYDYEYIDYVVAVLRKCKEYGFRVYMDPHQDIFSRFTGGSGAPYWVLPACGIDHRGFAATQAAFLHSEWPSPTAPDPAQFPDMLWATNYTRLAPATLSVLFFAGHDYAPRCTLDGGQPISQWLQDRFVAAVRELAVRVRDAGDLFDETVIGWDSLNEPNPTYIGLDDIRQLPEKWKLRQGPMPSPAQSMKLGVGQSQRLQNWVFSSLGPKKAGEVTIDPEGATIWLGKDVPEPGEKWGWKRDAGWPLGQCVWEAHGVWNSGTGEVLRPDHFKVSEGHDFVSKYWLPFWRKYASAIRDVHTEAIMFLQPPVFEPPPMELTAEDLGKRACVSCHFYDGLTLITKHWNWFNADALGLLRGKYSALIFALRFGPKAVRKAMRDQLGYLRDDTLLVLGRYPTLIGEIGVPFDLDKKRSYYGDAKGQGIGDYTDQTKALDASLNACDGTNLLSYTLWTYCADNTHKWGDGWNGEDLSIWSADDAKKSSGREEDITASATTTLVSRPGSSKGNKAEDGQAVVVDSYNPASSQSPPSRSRLDELCNGTRSAPAFWRPYPIAVVGTPVSIDFDVRSSLFHLVVDVGIGRDKDGDNIEPPGEEVPTEIFLPLIHYAADEEHASAPSSSDGQTKRHPGTHAVIEDSTIPALSIDVHLSAGRWEVQGQVMRWYLPASARGKRHEIKLQRGKRARGGGLEPRVRDDVVNAIGEKSAWERWEKCLEACCVM